MGRPTRFRGWSHCNCSHALLRALRLEAFFLSKESSDTVEKRNLIIGTLALVETGVLV